MPRKCTVIVLVLATAFCVRVATASTLEEEYILRPGWCPGVPGANIQAEHGNWHMIGFPAAVAGKEFVEFHREFLAQSDDFRLYGLDTPGGDVDPDAAAIPVLALPGSALRFPHANLNGYVRGNPFHVIDSPAHPGHPFGGNLSPWVPRPATLTLGNAAFYGSANLIGTTLDGFFHGNGHMSVANHDRVGVWSGDMGGTLNATRDGAFFQWHKNIDNIYADWAVGQYRGLANTGLPIYFSVGTPGVGAAGSSLNARRQANEYQGNNPPLANQYGAIPRIGSDIYVGDINSSNLHYQAGTREPGTLNWWDLDAFTILNAPGTAWYFSVTPGSVGLAGTAVAAQAVRGGDVFESAGGGTNALVRTEAQLGLLAAASDNLDALEVDQQKRVQATNDKALAGIYDRPKQWFSLRSGTTGPLQALGAAAVGPSDVLQFNPNGDLVITTAAATLGLAAPGNELDAMVIVDTAPFDVANPSDRIYYSLAAGSPALGANSPADIFCHTMGGATCGALGGRLEMTAGMLGLAATDDLDALDVKKSATGLGACCQPNGQCTLVPQTNCAPPNIFWGLETACSATPCPAAPGACCLPSGACTIVSDTQCLTAQGQFQGAGTQCSPALCPPSPGNDDCMNSYHIPYDYPDGYEPPADNTYAYAADYDPPYGCYDHEIFYPEYGSGTVWYSYEVPAGAGQRRSIGLTTVGTYDLYEQGGYAYDTRLGLYYAPNGDCSDLVEVACGDNYYKSYDPPYPPYGGYAYLQYDDPPPGTYYVQLSTVGDVYRGRIRLQVYEQLPVSVEDSPPSGTWLRVHPNPMTATVSIEYRSTSASVSMQIVDPVGRVVTQLQGVSSGHGVVHATWDRRDSGGALVSAGVYFVAIHDGGVVTKRIVVLQ